MARHHKHKEIDRVVKDAVAAGWTLEPGGHGLVLRCPCPKQNGGWVLVPSTPKNTENTARRIKRELARCPDNHELDRRQRPQNG